MERLAVIGTGLIGGSVVRRIAHEYPRVAIATFDADVATSERAAELGAGTRAASSLGAAIADAELVIVCVPVDQIATTLEQMSSQLPPGAVVTDVGSAKRDVVTAGEALLGERFVGGHPMAGSERHGLDAADPTLFQDAWWIVTPTERTSAQAYQVVTELVSSLGARPIAMAAEAHDALLARLSHLPQLAASALVTVAAGAGDRESLLGVAAGGFRDVTRIAASDPSLWLAILKENRDSILAALEGYGQHLSEVRDMLVETRWNDLESWLAAAREARLGLFVKAVHGGEPTTLTMLIPDRPGVLAEVTTVAGELGANIEDLQIFHSPEGGRGRLELTLAGQQAATNLEQRLIALGYHVARGLPE